MWQNGSELPDQAVEKICGQIRLWLAVKVFPLAVLIVILLTVTINDRTTQVLLAVLCGIWAVGIVWRDLMRIGRIKRREFEWCKGVTAGFMGKNMRGTVQVFPNGETVRAFGHPINTFYLRNGIPVYVVKLNINGRSFFNGGFISDPLAFKNKD